MSEFVLPEGPSSPDRVNPGTMIIFGKPKCGKTEITSHLTRDGWALLELEPGGADFVTGTVLKANSLGEIQKWGKAIKDGGYPYKGIIVDTVTKLEEMCLPLAAQMYRNTQMGANWGLNPKTRKPDPKADVRTLPNGAGYLYFRNAYFQMAEYVSSWADQVIFLGHLSEKLIGKEGEEASAKELDLTGKTAKLACSKVDAIAYCYREDNKTMLNFEASDELICGARSPHLKGKKIVIAESDDNDVITTYWDKVYVK